MLKLPPLLSLGKIDNFFLQLLPRSAAVLDILNLHETRERRAAFRSFPPVFLAFLLVTRQTSGEALD